MYCLQSNIYVQYYAMITWLFVDKGWQCHIAFDNRAIMHTAINSIHFMIYKWWLERLYSILTYNIPLYDFLDTMSKTELTSYV